MFLFYVYTINIHSFKFLTVGDIIIERWLPYSFTTKRKTIVQRAETPKDYPKPRNVIIQYDPPQVRIVRQFQRLGVTQENPQEYAQRFGPSLYDTQALIERARAAGVVEDIVSCNFYLNITLYIRAYFSQHLI